MEAYDRNNDFGKSNENMAVDYNMTIPDIEAYIDLHSEKKVCTITRQELDRYLGIFDKTLDKKVVDLYKEKYLCYIRVSSTEDFDFIRSACRAEMKRSVVYLVDIKLSKNEQQIEEAQCECGAGMGPLAHCKHITTALYAIHVFGKTGEVNVEDSCTQKLMTFHHTKRFTGSPLKAQDLNIPGADQVTDILFDPRPPQYRKSKSYPDYFRNVCLNFNEITSMPISHLFPPANSLAVAHDHDYLKYTPEELFLNSICVGEINESQKSFLEINTRGQSRNPLWKEERLKRLQSSEFGRICKATERTDHLKLAKSLQTAKNIVTPAIYHGQKHEAIAIRQYEKDSGCKIQQCGIFVSTNCPFLGASPDGIINDDVVIEVKCPYSIRNEEISTSNLPYLKTGESGVFLDKTHNYYFQIQGQLFCSERKKCVLIIYTLKDVMYLDIERDDKFISNMISHLKDFFDKFFKPVLLERLFYKSYNC